MINTLGSDVPNIPTEELEYYYPITPRIAILVTPKIDRNEKVELSDFEVQKYNGLMFSNRNEFILASTEILRTILPPSSK